jgi:glycosyltransferase involved in cell wall biosynthesis
VAAKISIVTGTLNRRKLLPRVVENTVDADDRLELVLVDGGSTDGTQEYVASLGHPRIKFIEVGHRSPYPHFMNEGLRQASHEWICQWNDDAFLVNPWSDVFDGIDDAMVYPFSWKVDGWPRFKDKNWVILDSLAPDGSGELVVNYGLYHKDVFRKVGMYNNAYRFYCTDADMAHRAYFFGFKVKSLRNVKVIALKKVKKYNLAPAEVDADIATCKVHIEMYKKKILPNMLEYLPA